MRRKWLALALALALTALLSACAGAEGAAATPSDTPAPTPDPLAEARGRAVEDMAPAVEEALAVIAAQPRDDLGTETAPFEPEDAWEGFDDLTEEQQAYLDAAAGYIVENMPQDASAYDKYRYLAYVLSLRAEYDYKVRDDDLSETPYGALAEGRAVCFGYVYTMQFLCERAGLYCKAIEGTANWNDGEHGWNLAMLPEGSYYMDITWCDQYGPIGSVEWREMFMVTEYRMRGDHGNWEGGPATGEEQYWSWKNI